MQGCFPTIHWCYKTSENRAISSYKHCQINTHFHNFHPKEFACKSSEQNEVILENLITQGKPGENCSPISQSEA